MVMAKKRECCHAFDHDQTRICLSTATQGISRPCLAQANAVKAVPGLSVIKPAQHQVIHTEGGADGLTVSVWRG